MCVHLEEEATNFDPKAEIWHGRTHFNPERSMRTFGMSTPTSGVRGPLSGAPTAQMVHFWDNFLKQKLKNAPVLVGAGQFRSGRKPNPGVWQVVQMQGASADMVLWLSKLKLGRQMGTHPERSMPMFGPGNPPPRVRGPYNGVQGSRSQKRQR